jgi:large subunit ribosomal protein L18
MAKKSIFLEKFRRRRESRTDYVKRTALLKAGKPRLVVRKSSKNFLAQFISSEKGKDNVACGSSSKELTGFGWKGNTGSIPSAYLTGFIAGLRAKEKKIETAVLDIGLASAVHGTGIFAVLKGAIDAGINIPHDESALPKKERIEGKHIEEYAKKLGAEELKKQFGASIAAGFDPKQATAAFEKAKTNIIANLKKTMKTKSEN